MSVNKWPNLHLQVDIQFGMHCESDCGQFQVNRAFYSHKSQTKAFLTNCCNLSTEEVTWVINNKSLQIQKIRSIKKPRWPLTLGVVTQNHGHRDFLLIDKTDFALREVHWNGVRIVTNLLFDGSKEQHDESDYLLCVASNKWVNQEEQFEREQLEGGGAFETVSFQAAWWWTFFFYQSRENLNPW